METTRPVDLWAAIAWTLLTVVMALTQGGGFLQVVLGVVFVVVLPGYTLLAVLFPERHQSVQGHGSEAHRMGLDPFERGVISLGLSIAIVSILLLALNFSPWALAHVPVIVTLGGFNTVASVAGIVRRRSLAPQHRLQIRLEIPAAISPTSPLDTALNVLLLVSLTVAVGTLAYVMANPNPGEPFTEFYVLGPEGHASYPENLPAGEPLDVTVGIENHEHSNATYEVTILDQTGTWIQTDGNRSFRPRSNTTLANWAVQVADEERWTGNRSLDLSGEGPHRVLFQLRMEGIEDDPYRDLRIYVNVTSGGDG